MIIDLFLRFLWSSVFGPFIARMPQFPGEVIGYMGDFVDGCFSMATRLVPLGVLFPFEMFGVMLTAMLLVAPPLLVIILVRWILEWVRGKDSSE